jgi:hypothetical protein
MQGIRGKHLTNPTFSKWICFTPYIFLFGVFFSCSPDTENTSIVPLNNN